MKILIKNGRVLNPATNMDTIADVLVEDGKVVAIEKGMEVEAEKVIDATDKFVMPGFIDLHVHFRDPGLTHPLLRPDLPVSGQGIHEERAC